MLCCFVHLCKFYCFDFQSIVLLFYALVYVLKDLFNAICILSEETINPFLIGFQNLTSLLNEPRYEKTGFLHMRKQRRRSASW